MALPGGMSYGSWAPFNNVALPAGMHHGGMWVPGNNVALPAGIGQGSSVPFHQTLGPKEFGPKVSLSVWIGKAWLSANYHSPCA